jgi:protein-tyrosine-phosphatase
LAINRHETVRKKKLLFLDTGDNCRCAMAEGYLKKLLAERGIDWIEVKTAGVMTPTGLKTQPEAVYLLKEEGVDISRHRSRPLRQEMLEEADLILGMTPMHVQKAHHESDAARGKTFLLKEYVGYQGKEVHIPDPMGGTMDIFKRVFEQIKDALENLVEMDFIKTPPPGWESAPRTVIEEEEEVLPDYVLEEHEPEDDDEHEERLFAKEEPGAKKGLSSGEQKKAAPSSSKKSGGTRKAGAAGSLPASTDAPRKRGRPRKHPEVTEQPPRRGRGRPPKAKAPEAPQAKSGSRPAAKKAADKKTGSDGRTAAKKVGTARKAGEKAAVNKKSAAKKPAASKGKEATSTHASARGTKKSGSTPRKPR